MFIVPLSSASSFVTDRGLLIETAVVFGGSWQLVTPSFKHRILRAVLRYALHVGAFKARVLEGAVILVLTPPRHARATTLKTHDLRHARTTALKTDDLRNARTTTLKTNDLRHDRTTALKTDDSDMTARRP